MDIYGSLFRSIFPVREPHIRSRAIARLGRDLERSQWASRDELIAHQTERLAALLRHAYDHVPFYRARYAAAGVAPGDVRSLEDLGALPIVRRAELQRARGAWASTARPRPAIRGQTRGTTAAPLEFGYEPASAAWRRAIELRGQAWAGHGPGARTLDLRGADASPRGADATLRRAVDAIERRRPRLIQCDAHAGADLARFITRNGMRSWPTIPVICGAERLVARDRADLVEAFGPAVFDTYGCREVATIAAECEAHAGLHVAMENVIVEIVVYEDGRARAAREGETGEVVVTDLHDLAMPFIRYANGDLATVGPDRRCPCGRTLPRLAAVEGRVAELARERDGVAVSQGEHLLAGLSVRVDVVPERARRRPLVRIERQGAPDSQTSSTSR